MPDYGHDLRLGAFLTPQSRRPQDVVALVLLSEQAGLDLVTFQDHPYQAALLDTWTLRTFGEEVAPALRAAVEREHARTQDVPLAVRSGGHGISGRSTNDSGIVLDLDRLDSVEVVEAETGRIRVGPGARWGEVARVLQPLGR